MNRYISFANEQYRRLMDSRNKKTYRLYTAVGSDQPIFRMESSDRAYLEDRGNEWVRLRQVDCFYIEEKK